MKGQPLAAIAVAALMWTASAASWAGHNTCFDTTRAMKSACRADIVDDFYEEFAKCLNSDEPRACRREARADLKEARGDCRDQAEARNNLCERLPDAGPYIVELDPDDFTGECTDGNAFFPMVPGTVTTFVSPVEDEEETIIVTVTHDTRTIDGIEAVIVNDRVFAGLPDEDGNPTGDPIEDTDDYYQIDNHCNVWYLGEIAQNFEDGFLTDLDGSFIAGEEGAQAGIIMLADPRVGDVYRQEFALGDAEDAAEVLSLNAVALDDEGEPVELEVAGRPDIQCNDDDDDGCLKTDDFIGNELDSGEFKYYERGVGVVLEQDPDGEVVLTLIKIEGPE